jgi:hypothetical protein
MSNNEFRCNCIEMTRAIKDKIDAKLAKMTRDEMSEYFKNINLKFTILHNANLAKSPPQRLVRIKINEIGELKDGE